MAIIKVVKYNGSPDVFAWKYPSEELGTWTQLIVNESQEAVLYKGGQALDIFNAGRHTLETANIPILSNLINLPFGGRSPFAAEIWYINKAFSLDIKWGTSSPIQLQDPKYKVFVPVRSFGQFGIQISDSKKFLTKLVGTLPVFNKESILKYFRGLYLTRVKDAISSYLIKKQISVVEINAYLDELSVFLHERIIPIMDEYGITLVSFYVNDINVPEGDSTVIKLKEALSKKAEMDIVGYNYTQERSFDTLEGAAKNTGCGQAGLMGAGIGLGLGVGVGGAMGGAMGGIATAINTKETKKCSECSKDTDTDKRFCGNCGADNHRAATEKEQPIKICSACGNKVEIGKKFCGECGAAVQKICPSCKVTYDCSSKFCPDCGQKL